MRPAGLAALALLVAVAGGPATGSEPAIPSFNARYDLMKGPFVLGESRMEYRRLHDDRYRYRVHTRAVGVAQLFYDGFTEERSEGRITDAGFRPLRYHYQREGGDNPRSADITFDREAGRVLNEVGNRPWRMDAPPDVLDRVVSPLQLMHDLAEGREDLAYAVADGGKLRRYVLSLEGRETVETPVGRFDTVKVVRRKEGGGEVTTLWCAPRLHYLAVRVEHADEDDGTFSLVLRRLAGMEPAPRAALPLLTG